MNRKSQKEIQVTTHMVRQFLQENEDIGYRDFHSNLLPGVDNVMGIRLPVLRKFAKQLSGMDWQEWFEQADDQWYEETMLRGLVSAYAKMECKERLTYVAKFVPDINNWAVSVYFAVFPDEMLIYLQDGHKLDEFTYKKSLQKITESYRVDKEMKKIIKEMRQRG